MSIIRQRKKNLILSGFIGFFAALIMLLTVYVIFLRGQESFVQFLLSDNQYQVINQEAKSEKVEKIKVYTVVADMEEATVITRDMLRAVEVDRQLLANTVMTDLEEIVGKKTCLRLSAKTFITKNMLKEASSYDIPYEIVEISGLKVPEILTVSDKINLRIHYPSGQDYTVINDKEVLHINNEENSFYIPMSQEEILAYSSAIEDENLYTGTKLYVTKIAIAERLIDKEDQSYQLIGRENDYPAYPLNPNAQHLSLLRKSDIDLFNSRMILDESLKEFFDQEGFLYNYDLAQQEILEEASAWEQESESDATKNTSDKSGDDALNTGATLPEEKVTQTKAGLMDGKTDELRGQGIDNNQLDNKDTETIDSQSQDSKDSESMSFDF